MNLDAIPLLGLLKGKLGYVNQRQKLLAENVANSDTPGYAPRDLKAFTFDSALKNASAAGGGLSRTNAMHLEGNAARASAWKSQSAPDSETRLDGNQVVLEEQMMKMTQSRLDFETAVGLYQQSMGLIRLAARKPAG
jgi:flagellar basal-body rod protein FlgB